MNDLDLYTPTLLPLPSLKKRLFGAHLRKAHHVIAQFNELISQVKNPEKVFSLLSAREVVACLQHPRISLSPREFLQKQAEGFSPKRSEKELIRIFDYATALHHVKKMHQKKITTALLCRFHGYLKSGSHHPKERGILRTRQNWIGPEGGKKEDAVYFPPDHQLVKPFMENLEAYLYLDEEEPLIQVAIYFGQLLLIHPFMDGNGRVARSLIPTILYQKGVTSSLLFYMSPYFHRHRKKYSYFLHKISSEGDWDSWILFFLQGVIDEGRKNTSAGRKILKAYVASLNEVSEIKGSAPIVDDLFSTLFTEMPTSGKKREVIERLRRKKWIGIYKRKMVSVKPLLTIFET